jgi:ATP-dependent Clp protease ATP-binding subunit ClpB
MDTQKLTAKVAELVNGARTLSLEEHHQELRPLHLAVVLFEDPEGIARQAVLKSSSEETLASVVRSLRKALTRLPKVEPAPDEVYLGSDLKKCFNAGMKLMKDKGDAFLGESVSVAGRWNSPRRPAGATPRPSRTFRTLP